MFKLPDLPFHYNALEPHIDESTMRIHHDKHHAAYVANLNDALKDQSDWLEKSVEEVVSELEQLPEDIRTSVRNNGGGHANHSLFWTIMTPTGGGEPQNSFNEALMSTFSTFDTFKEKFTDISMKRFGSGWAWLVVDNGKLDLMSTANQDSPLSEGKTPILGLDVWEHAYYLHYQNKRADYIKAWWNVVNWKEVSRRFKEAV